MYCPVRTRLTSYCGCRIAPTGVLHVRKAYETPSSPTTLWASGSGISSPDFSQGRYVGLTEAYAQLAGPLAFVATTLARVEGDEPFAGAEGASHAAKMIVATASSGPHVRFT